MWEELESHWRCSPQYSLLKTYSATTAPHTPACRKTVEYVIASILYREWACVCICVWVWFCLTYDSSTVSKGSGCEISWSWLAWSLLRRIMSHKVWDALDCLCERKKHKHMNIQSCKRSIEESVSSSDVLSDVSYSLFKIYKQMLKCPSSYLFISLRVNELYEPLG